MSGVIIIPSRIGSTRLPQKPLADINRKTLVQRVWEQAMKADIADVFIATDAEEIVSHVSTFGGKSIMTSPDLLSGTDRTYAALMQIDPTFSKYSYVVNVQGDIPNILPSAIVKTINLMKTGCDIATPVHKISANDPRTNAPSLVKAILSERENYFKALYFTRAKSPHGAENLYEHIGLYVYTPQALKRFVGLKPSLLETQEKLEQLRALEDGMSINACMVDGAPISIDTPDDLALARQMIS